MSFGLVPLQQAKFAVHADRVLIVNIEVDFLQAATPTLSSKDAGVPIVISSSRNNYYRHLGSNVAGST